jgi:adenine-specific DNA methylase
MASPTTTSSFIETQFPISKLSKESYKERKGSQGQSLTGLGKWWGRKPLILVRATLLGILLPATDDPHKDRDIFLKLLLMDEEGLWERKEKAVPLKRIYALLTAQERTKWFTADSTDEKPAYRPEVTRAQRQQIQRMVFSQRLSYDERLDYCIPAERMAGPTSAATWNTINEHLGTQASNLQELIRELGEQRFDRLPHVGDAFCGGGSVPFEVARLGCTTYASDLNPVAALLTWAALNIVGGGSDVAIAARQAQQQIYDAVDRQITAWGIEHNAQGWQADTYLYCLETRCPECGWMVPLAPSWVIAERAQKVVAQLEPDSTHRRFNIHIKTEASQIDITTAKQSGTIKKSSLVCPNLNCLQSTPISMIRGDGLNTKGSNRLRLWEADDLVPRSDDVFQERLYCIRWVETWSDEEGKEHTRRHYRAPDADDLARETRTLELLRERVADWQAKGYIPRRQIVPGDETTRLRRERGWTHWHNIYTPRQLLIHGLLIEQALENDYKSLECTTALLGTGICANYNSKLAIWNPVRDMIVPTSTTPTFNTLYNFGSRGVKALKNSWFFAIQAVNTNPAHTIHPEDVRQLQVTCDIWFTDPAYADAINYHELSEYFLAWYEGSMQTLFPGWYTDSKRALAIKGKGEAFAQGMIDAYRNLAKHMPDNGYQVVMFVHQDASVWANLSLILWAAGLSVSVAWCIGTETVASVKEGNYVQGTVLLVLRKQTSEETAFLDEISQQVELEVKTQLDAMLALEDNEDPNFGDTDYQLAAYAAALRVLTRYRNIEDLDIAYELTRQRRKGEETPIANIITEAVKTASNYLVPTDFDAYTWKLLTAEERFYLKGLDIGSHGEHRTGAYQELARGFGVKEYRHLLYSNKANETRLKTASEFAARHLGDDGFANSLVRHALFAVREVTRTGEVEGARQWLHAEVVNYWGHRKIVIEILRYLANIGYTEATHWQTDAESARLLMGTLENDHV